MSVKVEVDLGTALLCVQNEAWYSTYRIYIKLMFALCNVAYVDSVNAI